MKPLVFSLLLSTSALAVAPRSFAQPEVPPETTAVRVDYRKALAEMDKGNWQAARTLLLDLFQRSPTFDVAASLGETESKLGNNARAAQYLAYALKNVPPKEKADTSARIKAGLSALTGNLAIVRLSLNRKEADFYVDGEKVGSYPALTELYLSTGKHSIEARSGIESEKREVEAVPGTNKSMAFVLVAAPMPASGLAAPAPSEPPRSAPPTPAKPAPADDSEGSARPIALITGGSLAVIGFGLGIGFGVASDSAKSDADKYRAELPGGSCFGGASAGACGQLRDAVDRQSRDHTIANVGFVIGAVGLATVGVALLWPSDEKKTNSTSAGDLSIRWQGDRLLLHGTF